MPTFEFADCPTRLDLSKSATTNEQTGSVTCSVRNTLPSRQAGRVRIEPQGGAKPEWLSIAGAPSTSPLELEQDFAPGSAASLTVHVRVPAGAAPGAQTFRLRVTSEQKPDTDFALGPAIGFEVAAPAVAPSKPKVPAWAYAVIALVVLAIVGSAVYLVVPKGKLDARLVAGRSLAEAQKIAADEGYPGIGSQPGEPAGYEPGTVSGITTGADGNFVLVTDPGVTIPRGLRGQNVVNVVAALANIGLQVAPGEAREAGLDNNVVASVNPSEGSVVKLGDTIQVMVNEKPVGGSGGSICRDNPGLCVIKIRPEFFKRIEESTAVRRRLNQ